VATPVDTTVSEGSESDEAAAQRLMREIQDSKTRGESPRGLVPDAETESGCTSAGCVGAVVTMVVCIVVLIVVIGLLTQ
ncbi:hypothetical protein KIPB_011790, partial [Kipferlia bialata]